MEKDRKTRVIAIAAVFIALIGTTIGFAAFSNTLSIQGTAKVDASKWEIKFSNLQPISLVGKAKEVTTPTINTNDTTISDYSVELIAPGDKATYTFDVVNDGTFDAKITSINIPTPTCTGTGANKDQDETNVCSNVTYTLKYSDGTSVSLDDTLKAKETKTMKLELTYSSVTTSEQLPTNDVELSNLGVSLIYSQD